jgi:hypothetical protein
MAVLGFFGLAVAGWVGGASPLSCAMKALGGAAVIYVLTTVLMRVMVQMIVDTMMENPGRPHDKGPET